MTEYNRLLARGPLLFLLAAAFVAVHLFLFRMFWHGNQSHQLIPGVLFSVVVLLAVGKHVGLLTILLRRFHSVFHRRRRRVKQP